MTYLIHGFTSKIRSLINHQYSLMSVLSVMQGSLQSLIWTFWATMSVQQYGTVGMLYSFLSYIVFAWVGFVILGIIYSKYGFSPLNIFRYSLVVQCLSLIALTVFPGVADIYILGINGVATGAYWSARSPIDMEISNNTNINTYIAGIYLGRQILSVATPFFMGLGIYIIAVLKMNYAMAWINLIFCMPIFFCIYKVSNIELNPQTPILNFTKYIKFLKLLVSSKHRKLGASFVTESMFWSARTATFPLIAALNVQNLQALAGIETVCSLLSIIAGWFLLNHWKTNDKLTMSIIGVIGVSVCWVSVGLYPTLFTLAILSFSKSFFQSMIDTAFHLLMFRGIKLVSDNDEDNLGVLCARETILVFGRSFVILAIIGCSYLIGLQNTAFVGITMTVISGLLAYYMAHRVFKL